MTWIVKPHFLDSRIPADLWPVAEVAVARPVGNAGRVKHARPRPAPVALEKLPGQRVQMHFRRANHAVDEVNCVAVFLGAAQVADLSSLLHPGQQARVESCRSDAAAIVWKRQDDLGKTLRFLPGISGDELGVHDDARLTRSPVPYSRPPSSAKCARTATGLSKDGPSTDGRRPVHLGKGRIARARCVQRSRTMTEAAQGREFPAEPLRAAPTP